LRVTCVHWLGDGGIERAKLWDIFYLVDNRPQDFDWDRCLNAAGLVRRKWIVCAIALTYRFLNLNVDETPIAEEVKDPRTLPGWLISTAEKELNDFNRLTPLYRCIGNWQLFRKELGRRFPPNPIQASIETGAPFDDSSRLPYQIADVGLRLIKYSVPTILRKLNNGKWKMENKDET
jgi:hypothetical protein